MVTPSRRAVLALALGGALSGPRRAVAETARLVPVEQPIAAPPLKGRLLDGRAFDLQAQSGKVVLVSFWATWCPPCRRELPALVRLNHHLGEHGAKLVTVNLGDRVERLHPFLVQVGAAALPVVADPDRALAAPWHIAGLPIAYAVDPAGLIRLAALGAPDWDDAAIRRRLLALV